MKEAFVVGTVNANIFTELNQYCNNVKIVETNQAGHIFVGFAPKVSAANAQLTLYCPQEHVFA